jgi:hypothetical protein
MELPKHVVLIGEKRNAYIILVGKHEGDHSWELVEYGR